MRPKGVAAGSQHDPACVGGHLARRPDERRLTGARPALYDDRADWMTPIG